MSRDPSKTYVVSAPYVTLRTMTAEGPRMLGFAEGAPVPPDVPADSFDHHLSHGLITVRGETPSVSVGQSAEARYRQALSDVAALREDLARAQSKYDTAVAEMNAVGDELAAERAARHPAPEPPGPDPSVPAPGASDPGIGPARSDDGTPDDSTAGAATGDAGKPPAKAAGKPPAKAGQAKA